MNKNEKISFIDSLKRNKLDYLNFIKPLFLLYMLFMILFIYMFLKIPHMNYCKNYYKANGFVKSGCIDYLDYGRMWVD